MVIAQGTFPILIFLLAVKVNGLNLPNICII